MLYETPNRPVVLLKNEWIHCGLLFRVEIVPVGSADSRDGMLNSWFVESELW